MCATFQEIGDILQLWNVILTETAVIHQQWEHMIEFLARMRLIQFGQLSEHNAPGLDFLLGVFDTWQWLIMFVIVGQISEILSIYYGTYHK